MKIKSIRLTDVLSHVDSRVEIGQYLTVFTGVSDSGKSAMMRGLNQLCRNQPAGIDLLRHGAKRGACSEVEMVVERDDTPEGGLQSLVRRRGKSKNEYEVDGQPLLAIGREVPEEARNIMRLSAHAFQLQSDSIFMLGENDGEVAKMLSSTVGLSQIDTAFTQIRSRKTENDTALRVAQADLIREQAEADKFNGLMMAEGLVNQAETLGKLLLQTETDVAAMADVVVLFADMPKKCPMLVLGRAKACVSIAERLQAERAAAQAEYDSADALLLALRLIRPDVPTWEPFIIVENFGRLAGEYEVTHDNLLEMAYLHRDLKALSPDIGIAPRKAAMLLTQTVNARREQEMARIDIYDMQTLLAQMTGWCARRDRAADINLASCLCKRAQGQTEFLGGDKTELAEMAALYRDFGTLALQVLQTERQLKTVAEEIKRFMLEHPACPECGAEQQHWHIQGE